MIKKHKKVRIEGSPVEIEQTAELFEVYKDHSNVLRAWMAAYGVGTPVLLLSQEKLWGILMSAGSAANIAALFLIGVALQAFLAALNKYVMWSCYYGEINESYSTGRLCALTRILAKQAWIDLLVDFVSIICFAWSTYLCFQSIFPAS